MSTTLAELRRLNIEQQRAAREDEDERGEQAVSETPGQDAGDASVPASKRSGGAHSRKQGVERPLAQVSDQADAHARIPADASMRGPADTHMLDHASTPSREQALAAASDHVIAPALAQSSDQARASAIDRVTTETAAPAPETPSGVARTAREQPLRSPRPSTRTTGAGRQTAGADPFVTEVRDRIRMRRSHPGGTKPSVDMDPELLLRARRYCLDHGNPPLRNVLIELLSAFLEEEGY